MLDPCIQRFNSYGAKYGPCFFESERLFVMVSSWVHKDTKLRAHTILGEQHEQR